MSVTVALPESPSVGDTVVVGGADPGVLVEYESEDVRITASLLPSGGIRVLASRGRHRSEARLPPRGVDPTALGIFVVFGSKYDEDEGLVDHDQNLLGAFPGITAQDAIDQAAYAHGKLLRNGIPTKTVDYLHPDQAFRRIRAHRHFFGDMQTGGMEVASGMRFASACIVEPLKENSDSDVMEWYVAVRLEGHSSATVPPAPEESVRVREVPPAASEDDWNDGEL